MIGIEIINQCNFNCFFCLVSRDPKPLEMLSLEVIKKIARDIEYLEIQEIKLTPQRGEIFVHPEIYEILNVLTNIQCVKKVYFNTNFEKINFSKYLNSNIDIEKIEILISHYGCNGLDEFVSQTQKSEKEFNTVESNIEIARRLNIKVNTSPRTLEYKYDYKDGGYIRDVKPEQYKICSNIWVPRIDANGDFTLCTNNVIQTKDEIIGNIHKDSLVDLYLDNSRLKLYNDMKNGIIPKMCKDCTSFDINQIKPNISALKNFNKIKKINEL